MPITGQLVSVAYTMIMQIVQFYNTLGILTNPTLEQYIFHCTEDVKSDEFLT
jgi:hypothetical protein